MPLAHANGIEIAYETRGSPSDPALLLVMGLGCQLILWPEEFCDLLAERGFHVIRFDNRDIGLSTKFDDAGWPDLTPAFAAGEVEAAYVLEDMAADAAGLLDQLEIEAAHVVGVSMGGMIGQQLAISRPERVLSLVSIMSTTGDRSVGQPLPSAIPALIGPMPTDREGYARRSAELFKLIGSPAYPPDEQYLLDRAAESYDRCHHPAGFVRQLAAIWASPDRTDALGDVRVPTLVIHGEADPLITVSGGRATAEAVPGAQLLEVPGMGHDLPRELWPRFVDAIAENAARAQTAAAT